MDVATHGEKTLLRFLTCGSVDDGKSTLIGRLLFDSKLILEDQLATLTRDSRKHGTTGEDIDLALLVDGLEAEREQYTRNMATGASTSDAAVILIDARKGVLTQTRRHSYICSLLGIRHVAVAVNKIDLADYSAQTFHHIVGDYFGFAKALGFASITAIPLSARYGDNVTQRSAQLKWFEGPTLLEYLEGLGAESGLAQQPFRFPVQWVNRPNLDFRGFSGTVASGSISTGESIVVAASGRESRITRIVTADGDLPEARAGEAVTLVL